MANKDNRMFTQIHTHTSHTHAHTRTHSGGGHSEEYPFILMPSLSSSWGTGRRDSGDYVVTRLSVQSKLCSKNNYTADLLMLPISNSGKEMPEGPKRNRPDCPISSICVPWKKKELAFWSNWAAQQDGNTPREKVTTGEVTFGTQDGQ